MLTFDYNRTMQQVSHMEQNLLELKRLITMQYMHTINDIAAAWSGEASRLFLANCEELRTEMLKTVTEIDDLIDKTRLTAIAIKKAEANIVNLFSDNNGSCKDDSHSSFSGNGGFGGGGGSGGHGF